MDRNDRTDETRRDAERRARATGPERGRHVADDLRRDADVTGEEVGEAVGGISGVLTGAAIGSLGGPLGTIIGGIAGAVSGWWAGKAIAEAARHVTEDDDEYYRSHYDSSEHRRPGSTYDDVRPAYQLGHLAGRNPDYSDRSFDDVEHDLRHGWSRDVSARHGEWSTVRDYARAAYERGRTRPAAASSGQSAGAPAARSTERIDDTTDRIAMHERDVSDQLLDANENAWERTTDRARDLADRVEDKLDDTKDRIDGNPASRPGIDRTDDPDRRH